MLLGALVGGMIGGIMGAAHGVMGESIQDAMQRFMVQMQALILPGLIVIAVLSVLIGELNIHKLKGVGKMILTTEDEACDAWEYEEEKVTAFTTNMNTLSQVFCVIILSFGYSLNYIQSNHAVSNNFLIACCIFIACYVYDGFLSVRMIKIIQKIHPEKAGDPASRKFQKEWIESCDEAEKEMIYQSAYKTYVSINRCIPFILLVTMLGNLFFGTGVLATVVIGVVWLLHTMIYTSSCVKMKGQKLS